MTVRNYSSAATPTTLTGAGVGSNAGTDVTANVASVSGFPTPPFTAAIDRGTPSEECVLVTASAGASAWTIQRGYDGTTPQSHAFGAQFEHCVAAIDFREANQHNNASGGVHGVTGNVVGDTDTQTLVNKTLTRPTIADLTNAQHDHSTATRGGVITYAVGEIARAVISGSSAATTTELLVASITFTADSSRIYKFWTSTLYPASTVSGDAVGFRIRIAAGTTVTTGSNRLIQGGANAGSNQSASAQVRVDSLSGQQTVGLFVARIAGSGSVSITGSVTLPIQLTVEDAGAL